MMSERPAKRVPGQDVDEVRVEEQCRRLTRKFIGRFRYSVMEAEKRGEDLLPIEIDYERFMLDLDKEVEAAVAAGEPDR